MHSGVSATGPRLHYGVVVAVVRDGPVDNRGIEVERRLYTVSFAKAQKSRIKQGTSVSSTIIAILCHFFESPLLAENVVNTVSK